MEEVSISETESRYFGDLFVCCDAEKIGKVPILKATEMFRSANLSNDVIRQVSVRNDEGGDDDGIWEAGLDADVVGWKMGAKCVRVCEMGRGGGCSRSQSMFDYVRRENMCENRM